MRDCDKGKMTTVHENMRSHCRGQGIVEYLLLMAAVIAVLLVFFSRNGVFEKSFNNVITTQAEGLLDSTLVIFGN